MLICNPRYSNHNDDSVLVGIRELVYPVSGNNMQHLIEIYIRILHVRKKMTKIQHIIWGLSGQKQASQAAISNYMPQFTLGCSYLSLSKSSHGKLAIRCHRHKILPVRQTSDQPGKMSDKKNSLCCSWCCRLVMKTSLHMVTWTKEGDLLLGSFCACAQPMRDAVTL